MSSSSLAFDEVPRGNGGSGATEAINQVLHDAGVDAPASLYDEALNLARDGHLAPAADRLRMLLVLDPSDADANLLLGKVYAGMARWQDALSSLDAASHNGAVLPPGLRDEVAEALRREVQSAEAERQRLQARERGEVRSLRTEAKRLRTENAVLEQRIVELDQRVRLWSGATAVVAGCASALLLAAMVFGRGGDAAPETETVASGEAAEVVTEPATPGGPEIQPIDPVGSQPAAAAPAPAAKPAAPAASGGVMATHTVKSGENLSAIAKKYYGKSSQWKKILAANESVLHGDVRKLRPGQKLTIPE